MSAVLRLCPVPAARPRVSRWGTYYPKTYKNWRNEAESQAADLAVGDPLLGPLHVLIENVVALPKTSILTYPGGDVDNYAKGTLDVMQKATEILNDDKQVCILTVMKRFATDGEEAYTRFHWYELET